jgi:hypothetical protein
MEHTPEKTHGVVRWGRGPKLKHIAVEPAVPFSWRLRANVVARSTHQDGPIPPLAKRLANPGGAAPFFVSCVTPRNGCTRPGLAAAAGGGSHLVLCLRLKANGTTNARAKKHSHGLKETEGSNTK